jgi:hypothetical protein
MSTSRPRIYTLCGSTRFPDAFALANTHLSLQGHIVIGLGMMGHADEPRGARFLVNDGLESSPTKQALDQLHFRKIDLSDAIFVCNLGGYIGSSTRREIFYANGHDKDIEWMFGEDLSWVEHLDHDIPDEKCDYCLIYLNSLDDLVTREAGAA